MSDNQNKPETPENDENPFRYLDRDSWYGEETEETAESPATEQERETTSPVEDVEPVTDEAASLAVEESVEFDAPEESSGSAPDPYSFGEYEAEPEPEPATEPDPQPVTAASRKSGGVPMPEHLTNAGSGFVNAAGSFLGKFFKPAENFLKPMGSLVATRSQRGIGEAAIIVALISLISNNAAFALLVLTFVAPLLIVLAVVRQDVFENEPPVILIGVGLVGVLAGLIVGGLSDWIYEERWFEWGTLSFGAAGFAGIYADNAGNPDFLVWLLNGLVFPLLGLAAVMAVPILLRRYQTYRNEITDGAILGVISAAGYAIGMSIVFLSPGIGDGLPWFDVRDWTFLTVALVAVRPVILTLIGANFGIAIWRYMRDANTSAIIAPVVGSVGATILLSLGTLSIIRSGITLELIWNVIIAVCVYWIFRRSMSAAIEFDETALAAGGASVTCPSCGKLTPDGAFCANCGQPL